MEYYIMKQYKSRLKLEKEVEKRKETAEITNRKVYLRGINVFKIICLVIAVGICIAEAFFSRKFGVWFTIVGFILSAVFALAACFSDSLKGKRIGSKKIDDSVKCRKDRIEVLDNLLKNEYGIATREKVEELKSMYQSYIDDRKKEQKTLNKFILSIASFFAGAATVTLQSLNDIGFDFNQWIKLFAVLTILFAAAETLIFLYGRIDFLKYKYETMIKDLNDLLLLKYPSESKHEFEKFDCGGVAKNQK